MKIYREIFISNIIIRGAVIFFIPARNQRMNNVKHIDIDIYDKSYESLRVSYLLHYDCLQIKIDRRDTGQINKKMLFLLTTAVPSAQITSDL